MSPSTLSRTLIALSILPALAAPAQASTPAFVKVDASAPSATVKGKQLRGTLTISNPMTIPVVVELRDRRGDDVGIDVPARRVSLAPGERGTARFTATVRSHGAFVVRPRVIVRGADGKVLGATDGALGVRRTRSGVRADRTVLHSRAPLKARASRWAGPYRDFDDVDPLEVGDLPDMVERGGLGGPADLDAVLPPDGGDPPYDPSDELDELRAPWTGPTGPDDIGPRPPKSPTGPNDYDSRPVPFPRTNPVPDGCIGGKLVIRTKNGPAAPAKEYLGAFGWSAMVKIYDRDAPLKVDEIVRVELDSLGEWEFCAAKLKHIGAPFSYRYESVNRYVAMLDEDTDAPHRVVNGNDELYDGYLPFGDQDPIRFKSLWLDGSDSEGPWDGYGLGDVMRWSMEWTLTLAAAGIDPDPTQDEGADDQVDPVHEVVFPNTEVSCGLTASCFIHPETNRVYLGFQEHDVDPFVIKHELSHSLHFRSWGTIPGSGSHDFENCQKRELAASEGFADFLAIWADNPDSVHGVDVNGYFHHGPEVPTTGCNPDDPMWAGKDISQEVWVVGALWDLADHHADGADVTGTSSWSAIPRRWLTMPWLEMANDPQGFPGTMRAFEAHYKSKIDPKWHGWVTGVFDQNHMHNP